MLVTVSGKAGTGTTTLSRRLSTDLDLPHYYAGAIFREMAREQEMSLEAFGRYAEENHEVDLELDERMVEIAERGNAVLEGRLAAWHAVRADAHEDALRVLLTATERTRAERIADREDAEDVEDVLESMRARQESEETRYDELYDVDPGNRDLYDLVVDTEEKDPDEVARVVLDALPPGVRKEAGD